MTDQSSLNPNRPNLTKSGNIENIENFESNINHGVGIINDNPPNVVNPYSSPTAPLSHPQLNEGSSAVTNDSNKKACFTILLKYLPLIHGVCFREKLFPL